MVCAAEARAFPSRDPIPRVVTEATLLLEARALVFLRYIVAEATTAEIADHLKLSRPTAYLVLRSLEDLGFLVRSPLSRVRCVRWRFLLGQDQQEPHV